MIRLAPRSRQTVTLFPYTTFFRANPRKAKEPLSSLRTGAPMNRLGDYVSVSAYATSLTAVAGPFPPRALTTELARMPPISVTSKLPVTVTVATVPAPLSATPVTGQVTVVRDVSVQKKSAAVTEAGATG